jgi:4,5-DOPA dioxygenase extradiol
MDTTDRLPVLFIGHGSPMNAIEDNRWRRSWEQLGAELRGRRVPIRAILCISAHWLTQGWWVTAMAQPRTIHDFGGFPQALFDQQYPAPGAPELARELAVGVRVPDGTALGLDEGEWGLDHGSWSVLKPMFPEADIPVLQLSMDYGRPPDEHLAIGRQLRAWRSQGVLIVASGNIVHNLRAMQRQVGDDQAYDWAVDFDTHIAGAVARGDANALADFRSLGDAARLSHPSWEHYLPLLYAAGAAEDGEPVRFFNEGFQAASISMRSMLWG